MTFVALAAAVGVWSTGDASVGSVDGGADGRVLSSSAIMSIRTTSLVTFIQQSEGKSQYKFFRSFSKSLVHSCVVLMLGVMSTNLPYLDGYSQGNFWITNVCLPLLTARNL